MRRAIAICLALASAPALAADSELARVRAECAREWPESPRMQEHCIRRQEDGARWAVGWMNAYRGADAEQRARIAPILRGCVREWRDDAAMLAHCLRTETEAYARLQGIDLRLPR